MSRLASIFAALGPQERAILRLKALIGPATGKNVFMNCLNRLSSSKPAWTSKTLTPVLEALREKKLLTEDLACVPGIIHRLAVEVIDSPDGAAMMAAIHATLGQDGGRSWDYRTIETSTLRWQRLAVLLNDGDEFQRAIERHGRTFFHTDAPSIFDQHFAGVEVGAEWLASRLPVFQSAILTAKANRWIGAGLGADYPSLMEHCHREPGLRAVAFSKMVDFDLLTGQLGRLDQTLADLPKDTPADLPFPFRASRALLTGDPKTAVALFAEALKLYRKSNRKRKGGLPGYVGLLQVCALLAADDVALQPEIEALTEVKEGHVGLFALRGLLELTRNKETVAKQAVQAGLVLVGMTPHPPPVSTGLLAVAAALIDPEQVHRRAVTTFMPLFRAVESSMALPATMLAEALEHAGPDPVPYRTWLDRPDNEIAFRFLTLIKAKAPWERALESLEAMLAPARPAEPAPGAQTRRLVWLVNPDTREIQPVEQALKARGWSQGRAVALKRLREGDPALDYLDEFDRRACRAIRRAVESWYNRDVFECHADSMLPALIGHPRVFDARSPAESVDLIAGRPELVLASDKTGFRLSLSHAAAHPGAFIEIDAPGRWRVVVVDAGAIEAASILSAKGVAIPSSARERLSALARLTAPALPIRIETAEIEDAAATDGDPSPVVRLSPLGEGLKVALVVRPAGAHGPHFLPGQGGRFINAGTLRVRRDLEAERRLAATLSESCPSLGGDGPEWVLDDLVASLEFLGELRSLPTSPAMEWPEGQKMSLKGVASAKGFKASVKGMEHWFSVSGTVAVDDDLVLDLKDLLDRLDNMQGRFVPLDGGGFIALDRQFRQQLERLSRLGDGLKIPNAAGVAVRDLLDGAASVKADTRWKDFVRRLDEAEGWEPTLAPGFAAELRDYQRDGFAWMSRLERWGAGALLADDMGLGKTVQAIAVMTAKAAAGPMLVVAPTSVCGNWDAELNRFAPALRPVRLVESDNRDAVIGGLGAGDVLIVSYGLLAREQDRLTAISWAMAILDEAQAIKNPDTRRAEASRRLKAEFRLALTGTPVENDLDELWSIFAFVNPGLLGARERFARRFATPISRDNSANAKAALKALVRPFLLRRTKAQVLSELPPRTEQTILVELEAEERAFYEALRQRALERLDEVGDERTRIHILAEITRLRQACCHPALVAADSGIGSAKLEAFVDLVDNLIEGRHRALVFSQFVSHLGKVRGALDAKGIAYQYLDGSTPEAERHKRVAAFQAGAGEMFLISLKAGGFGLNLTAADYVIHLDPWWNPAVEDQASDRAHRIGQSRPVTIYRLIVKDSIEERIVALHRHKRNLADALLEGADASAQLSEEDLLNLIRSSE
ncbi:DEAD/DEAH box helicase [Blastochloris viridis]|uniref:ATP-dependent helicase HepA n=1 Tax=Blastochloris viridis TaxID=1079 RepID=A0A0H5BEK5_BLAVI|nr:DEAD/DEAH box helicase [Blastochloris viridis]BAS00648.1 Superfamily II DNA/RNA helicases [Blastochloris viridis]CUU42134.1 ATP-dependent helicase HepA [Blastochloris viridis]